MNPKPLAIATTGMALILLIPGLAMGDGDKTYKVTITNLTAGQPLTPPVLVIHGRRTGKFTVGEMASAEIQAIAENGNSGPLQAALGGNDLIPDVHAWSDPVAKIEIERVGHNDDDSDSDSD